MHSREIVEKVDREEFKDLIDERKGGIEVSEHALDHLSQRQREEFTERTLQRLVVREVPDFVGLQRNGRYAAYYQKKGHYTKVIVEVGEDGLDIVTFMNKEKLPRREGR